MSIKNKKEEKEVQNSMLEAINQIKKTSMAIVEKKKPEIVDIITFCVSPEYLDLPGNNFRLFISQRVILKAFYMNTRGNENSKLTKEEWEWLYQHEKAEERDGLVFEKNGRDVIDKLLKMERAEGDNKFIFRELCLVLGRRGSKCHEENQLISTTIGYISFRELCDRVNQGERIGICTYDPKTLRRSVTYDINLEDNGIVGCFKVKTKCGFEETASYNHPYLIWRDNWEKPKFIDISKIKEGDRIAVANNINLSVKTVKTKGKTKSTFDSMPRGVWKYIDKVIAEKKLTNKEVVGEMVNDRLRKQHTLNSKKVYAYGKNIDDEFLKDMGSSDVKWDVVDNVINVGQKNTIAMEVRGTNIIGTYFVSHNTILASVITAYEIYKLLVIGGGDPHKFYGLPYDDEIAIINVALSLEQAGRLFGQVQARIRNSSFFKGRVAKETTKEIRFYTDKDLEKKNKGMILSVPGSILMLCGHSNPDTLAGYSAILILFDELAFYDESGKVTGSYFYDRLKPSLAKFQEFGDGRLVEISSPNSMGGIFYNIFMDSKKEDNILALQLPTWCSNPDISYEGLTIDRQRNPDMFMIEYGAQWSKTSTMGPFFPEGLIERCIRLDMEPHNKPKPGFNYYIHVDPANGGDRYVLLIVAKEYYKNLRGQKRNRVYLANIKIYEPTPGIGLQFNTIDQDVLRICSIFHPLSVSYDSWQSIQSLQYLRTHGVTCIPTTYNRNYKLKIYQNLLDMMSYHEGPELLLYDDPLLILEMKALKKKQIQRGMSIVKDKRGSVKTDDVVDCLAGAVSMASGHVRASLPEPVTVDMGYR